MPKEGNSVQSEMHKRKILHEMWKISLWQILPFGRKAGEKKGSMPREGKRFLSGHKFATSMMLNFWGSFM